MKLLIPLLLLLAMPALAQRVEWTRYLDLVPGGRLVVSDMAATGDGGAVIVVTRERNTTRRIRNAGLVVRVDRDGRQEWLREIPNAFDLWPTEILILDDGDILVGGRQQYDTLDNYWSRYNAWLARLDSDGRVEWQRMYRIDSTGVGDRALLFQGIAAVSPDRFLMLVGPQGRSGGQQIAQLDGNGEVIALRQLPPVAGLFSGLYPTGRGTYWIQAGSSWSAGPIAVIPGRLIEVGDDGSHIATIELPVPDAFSEVDVQSVRAVKGGGIEIVGTADHFDRNPHRNVPFVARYHSDNTIRSIGHRTFDSTKGIYSEMIDAEPTADGGFIAAMNVPTEILRFDDDAHPLWSIPLMGWQQQAHVVEVTPGARSAEFMLATADDETMRLRLVKISGPNGTPIPPIESIPPTSIPLDTTRIAESFQFPLFEVYPTPATTLLHIDILASPGTPVTIELLDVLGQSVKREERIVAGTIDVAIADLVDGVYLCRVRAGERTEEKRVVIVR